MRISQFVFLGAVVVLSATLALTTSRAYAQDNSVFGSQQLRDTETSPDKKNPPLVISGPWSGPLDDNLAGEGTLDVDFTEAPNGTLSGDWSFEFAEGTDFGTIKGKATSDKVAISFIFTPKKPYTHCKFSIATTDASDTEISAPYHFTACGPHTKDEHGTLMISPTPE